MYASTDPSRDLLFSASVNRDRLAQGEFAWRVLEEIDYGLMLVTPTGELQHANHLARQELTRGHILRTEAGRVVGLGAAHTELLMNGVECAALGRRQMIALHCDAGSLTVACVPLGSSVLLMLSRAVKSHSLGVSMYARMHRLTPAEESVLKGLCDGLDVSDIATAHGVAQSTIRTQVRSLRDKTGIGSIRLLVQHIAALPPVVTAIR